MAEISRREFLAKFATGVALSCTIPPGLRLLRGQVNSLTPELVVVQGPSPRENVRHALNLLGGIGAFVRRGDVVVVKPNMSWDRLPEQAANTNPEVVAEIVRLCIEAGARKVKVFDRTCNEPRRCYQRSGIQAAAAKEGAEVSFVMEQRFREVHIPEGELLKSWPMYRDVLEADVLINVPILKHHSVSGLTMGLKNMMGVLGGDRGQLHHSFDKKISDINTVLRPQLTVLDATRVLVRNGPQGGNVRDVRVMDTVVAGVDRVAVDAYGAQVFGLQPEKMGFLVEAAQRGLGKIDLTKLRIQKTTLREGSS
ncbi:MAG: DUF362 domain-containing protein [candidate division KSB1 bacterium]|nr:DUF362 domain-containing protein [candidate division KSB1 bacterium]MDZ7386735.1 DUF362 domain-containing protein [candidate division KSB1 bacterium]MDZ7392404.1 DUF362 domain-containing protein [candidate division KSB1 bacterium]MDZ7413513.1 DUF362 domain-containing protein [candidate division KSB1 bacterium]